MNCFQFDYFCGYHTADAVEGAVWIALWIAFNLITFVDITQHLALWWSHRQRCELLSIWLLLWISHSDDKRRAGMDIVVNCFQFDYFCGYHTANKFRIKATISLWIAFNLITFVDITQLIWLNSSLITSCELLSIWLLLWISHSHPRWEYDGRLVVNCFQFDYFCGYHTAARN